MLSSFSTGLVFLMIVAAPAPAPKADKAVMLQMESQPLTKVVKFMSKITGRNFILQDRLNHQQITIISGSAVTPQEAYRAFIDALHLEGMYTREEGKFVRIGLRPFPDPQPVAVGIERVGETTWRIDRAAVQRWAEPGAGLSVQARIVPVFENGRPNGFKIFGIQPGSIYSRTGIQDGDVIQKVAGQVLVSPEKAMALYKQLNDAESVEVDILRRGKSLKHRYEFR